MAEADDSRITPPATASAASAASAASGAQPASQDGPGRDPIGAANGSASAAPLGASGAGGAAERPSEAARANGGPADVQPSGEGAIGARPTEGGSVEDGSTGGGSTQGGLIEGDAIAGGGAAQAETEALRLERDEMRDRFMRALAEAENVRKRAERDRREAEAYGGSRLARDLLPVFDNLTRALESAGEEGRAAAGPLIEGVELTLRELTAVLARHGVEAIVPAPGDRFDPQLHQAMFEAPVPGTRAGEIIQVMTRGFLLHERLLRPAQVGVSSTPAA